MIAYMAYVDNSSIKKLVSFILDGWHKSSQKYLPCKQFYLHLKRPRSVLIHIGQQTIDQLQMNVLSVVCQTQTTLGKNLADKKQFVKKRFTSLIEIYDFVYFFNLFLPIILSYLYLIFLNF